MSVCKLALSTTPSLCSNLSAQLSTLGLAPLPTPLGSDYPWGQDFPVLSLERIKHPSSRDEHPYGNSMLITLTLAHLATWTDTVLCCFIGWVLPGSKKCSPWCQSQRLLRRATDGHHGRCPLCNVIAQLHNFYTCPVFCSAI